MKVKFFAAKYTKKIALPEGLIKELPEKIALYTTIQFLGQLGDIILQLKKAGKKNIIKENKNYYYDGKKTKKGHLLGCSLEVVNDADAFLFVGDGDFHPQAILLNNTQPVFCFNPFSKKWSVAGRENTEKIRKMQRVRLSKFLLSKEVGVIISVKQGQNQSKKALILKERYPGKNFYFVVFNDVNFSALENFPFVECWVNTACPRIGVDELKKIEKPLVNINDLEADRPY